MTIRIGKLIGIPIKIDISWLVAFILIVYSLAKGYFQTMYQEFTPTMDWVGGIVAALLLFASVLLHELMHSYVAIKNGLPVGGITLFIFGGISQLNEEPRTPEVELKMALAGPATSLVLGGAILLLMRVSGMPHNTLWAAILGYLGLINVMLGVFNLIPGFPLDGGRVLRAILWGTMNNLDRATKIASTVGQGFGYLFIIGGLGIMLTGQVVSGLWLLFIGWFLNNAAQQSYQQSVLRKALSGVDVHTVMTTDYPHVDPDTTIDQFVHDYLLK
ncbi:MAG TPA: site-2 protease family protein, partial [Armatimonadota bacterium]